MWSRCWGLPMVIRAPFCLRIGSRRGKVCSTARPCQPDWAPLALISEYGLDLRLERLGVDGLDDVIANAGFFGGDHVLGLRFRGHHNERCLRERGIGAHFFEQLVACQWLHIPV